MKKFAASILTLSFVISGGSAALAQSKQAKKEIPNRLIDYRGFQKIVMESAKLREKRRLTEVQFLKAMQEKGVVVLDARTDKRYAMLHIQGAINLPFTEFTAQSLAKVIPNKNTKILIYCNNNFKGSPVALASKTASASLNLSTYTSLVSYGYKNIYELGPLLDVATTKLPFAGEHVQLEKLFASSHDWKSRLDDEKTAYKFVRYIEGPQTKIKVFQEIPAAQHLSDDRKLKTLMDASGGMMGFVIETPDHLGTYISGASGAETYKYLLGAKKSSQAAIRQHSL
jgi:hypothetical protein